MSRPRLLDLFCCQGGAAMGYHLAGFDVVGVDIEPQPRYPFEFHQGDALHILGGLVEGDGPAWLYEEPFDALHVSPTCQTRARVTDWRGSRDNHPDTLAPTLEILRALDTPWVVENVPEAVADGTMRPDFLLCGTMFDLPVRRHRVFETNRYGLQPQMSCRHRASDLAFQHKGERAFADAMGCVWMTNRGGRQALPPAYTEFIGAQLIEQLERVA